jgi:hypothetical protein
LFSFPFWIIVDSTSNFRNIVIEVNNYKIRFYPPFRSAPSNFILSPTSQFIAGCFTAVFYRKNKWCRWLIKMNKETLPIIYTKCSANNNLLSLKINSNKTVKLFLENSPTI